MNENQEIYCHNCGKYVQFPIDLEMNGKHILKCPVCEHEHCRYVYNGIITDDRWDQRNGIMAIYQVNPIYVTSSATSASTNTFTYGSWGSSTSVTSVYIGAIAPTGV